MAWLKESDTSANHPIVLAALELDDADDRILNEAFGFVNRCAVQSAQYETDYVVRLGVARQTAGLSRFEALAAAAEKCGYWTPIEVVEDDGTTRKAFKLVEDTDLFHMLLKSERDWNNRQRNDNRKPKINVPVRVRDGDACRWCGQSVTWTADKKTGRGGTYDHLDPGSDEPTTIETQVIACRSCNSARGRLLAEEDGNWDKPLMDPPTEPYYSAETVAYLARHGVTVEATEKRKPIQAAPAAAGQHAPVESPDVETSVVETPTVERPEGAAPAGGAPAGGAPSGRAPGEAPSSAVETPGLDAAPDAEPPPPSDLPPAADRRSDGSRSAGTGRDGLGWVGTGLAGLGLDGLGLAGSGLVGGLAGTGGASGDGRARRPRRGKRGGKR